MRALCVAMALLAAGCVFRSAPEPRFYRPDSAVLDGTSEAAPESSGAPLRIRPVRSTPLLREQIVWRVSPVEYGLYEQRRWSELPESYVARALANALRATPGVRLSDEPGSAALRVEVVAFDEVHEPPRRAEISLAVVLESGDGRRVLDRTFAAEAPIVDTTPAATAAAMGAALDEIVGAVSAEVGVKLSGG